MTTLTPRRIRDGFLVTGPDIAPAKFKPSQSARSWLLKLSGRPGAGASRRGSLTFCNHFAVHSVQRPENINNLYPVVTSRRESKRANAHRDWSHLALRKPATSRPVAGSYGGHRFSRVMVPTSPARAPPAEP